MSLHVEEVKNDWKDKVTSSCFSLTSLQPILPIASYWSKFSEVSSNHLLIYYPSDSFSSCYLQE